ADHEIDAVSAFDAVVSGATPDTIVAVMADNGIGIFCTAHDHVLSAREAEIVRFYSARRRIVALHFSPKGLQERIVSAPGIIGGNLGELVNFQYAVIFGKGVNAD